MLPSPRGSTNSRLLVFAVLLIIVGVFTGYDVISFFGVILLFPALLIPSQSLPPRKVEQKKEQPRRMPTSPPPATAPETMTPAMGTITPSAAKQYVPMSSQPSSSAALFPNTMFPTLSMVPAAPQPREVGKQAPAESRDELLEIGLLLLILRIVAD